MGHCTEGARLSMDVTKRRDVKLCLLLVLILAGLYGACQNGRWVPSGSDGAYYLVIARNLVEGKGYNWDGGPVTLSPPVWPAVLAAVMRVSRSFIFLNLVLVGFCLGGACMWYWLMRRFTSPLRAFGLALLTGVLFEWHRFTFTHYAEALFYLLVVAALLLAFQINENKPAGWRIPLLVLLCASMVVVRYAGLLLMPLIVCALAGGQIRPRVNRQWLAIVLACAMSVAAFVGFRRALRDHAVRMQAQAATAAQREKVEEALQLDSKISTGVWGQRPTAYLRRARLTGHWMSLLFWPPVILGQMSTIPKLAVNTLGWVLILLFASHLPSTVKKRQWIWPGLLFYVLLLPVLWGRPVARYYAPVAPLLLLGICRGIEAMGRPAKSAVANRLTRAATGLFLISVGVCNLSILAVSAWIARSGNFHDVCLAGEYGDVLRLAKYLNQRAAHDGRVGVCVQYHDLRRKTAGSWVYRMLVLLSSRQISMAPKQMAKGADDAQLLAWARSEGVRFVVTRPEHRVRRVWHFRLPLMRASVQDRNVPFYVLGEVTDDGMVRVELPAISSGLKRVPGLR